MFFSLSNAAALLGLATTATATYIPHHIEYNNTVVGIQKRAFSCSSPVKGLAKADCEHMSKIGMAGQGYNPTSKNSNMWIGTQGPNKFNFINRSSPSCPITIVVWHMTSTTDYQSSFVNVRRPRISYTLAKAGDSVTVSMANGVSGGWAGLYNRNTKLSGIGQVHNTWGEFTTGASGTVDVSRLVRMDGNPMSIRTGGGCTSDMGRCVFVCKKGNTCGASKSYDLKNCKPGSQPGATHGTHDGNPTGGCQGFSNGGSITIDLSR